MDSAFRQYEFAIQGILDVQWEGWFEEMAIHHTHDGNTILRGPIVDQSALHGVLRKIHNLGLTLISVNPLMEGDGS
uniref:BON domain-containing protein n=2 Tax=Litorilinea aerophila TaxID=1204385 RepID=A0A540VJD2_9CHLR